MASCPQTSTWPPASISMDHEPQHGVWQQLRSQTLLSGPLALLWSLTTAQAMDIDTDPCCGRVNDPEMALSCSTGPDRAQVHHRPLSISISASHHSANGPTSPLPSPHHVFVHYSGTRGHGPDLCPLAALCPSPCQHGSGSGLSSFYFIQTSVAFF